MNPKKDIKIFIKLASEEDTEKIYNLMNNSFKSPDSSVNYRDLYPGERISYQEIKSIIESKTTDFILFFNQDNNDLISCETAELRLESNILFLGNKCVNTNCKSNYLSVLTTLDTMLLYKALILKKKIEKLNSQNNKYDKYNKYVDEVIEYFSIKYDFNNENISKMKIYNCSNLCDVVEYNSVIIKGYGDRIAKSLGFKFVKEVTYNKKNPPLGMKDLLKDVTVVFVKIEIFDNFNFDESTYMLNKLKFENRMIKNDYYNKQLAAEYPKNFFLEDELMQKYYKNFIFQDSENEKNKKEMEILILEDLNNFGKKCNQKYINLAKEAEIFKPVLYKYDSYGK